MKGRIVFMEQKRLKVGIIGCGGIANGKHMPSIKAVNMSDMVAFCDLIEERAVKAAKEYGVPGAKVYTDYKELLADPEIDVPIIRNCWPIRRSTWFTSAPPTALTRKSPSTRCTRASTSCAKSPWPSAPQMPA